MDLPVVVPFQACILLMEIEPRDATIHYLAGLEVHNALQGFRANLPLSVTGFIWFDHQ